MHQRGSEADGAEHIGFKERTRAPVTPRANAPRVLATTKRATASLVKGFGCRPVVTYPAVLRAGVGKPPRKEPAGAGGGSAVYGDLVERRLASGVRGPGSAAERR